MSTKGFAKTYRGDIHRLHEQGLSPLEIADVLRDRGNLFGVSRSDVASRVRHLLKWDSTGRPLVPPAERSANALERIAAALEVLTALPPWQRPVVYRDVGERA